MLLPYILGATSGPPYKSKITRPDTDTLSFGGNSSGNGHLAISRDAGTCIISAPTSTVSTLASVGVACIYTRSGSTWTFQQKLSPGDPAANMVFSHQVAISDNGNTVVIGAPTTTSTNLGAAYIFTRSGTTWTQQAKLLPTVTTGVTWFGFRVTISGDGDTVAIGATTTNVGAGTANGDVFIFTRSGTTWTQQIRLSAYSTFTDNSRWGNVSISKDGNTLAVSRALSQPSLTVGNVRVFYKQSGAAWTTVQAVELQAGSTENTNFGNLAKISGNGQSIIAPASYANSTGFTSNGVAYLYTGSQGTWSTSSTRTKLWASNRANSDRFGGDYFGQAISDNGTIIMIAATESDHSGRSSAGTVYRYTGAYGAGGTKEESFRLTRPDPHTTNFDYFGLSISMSETGSHVLIGDGRQNVYYYQF